VELKFIGDRSGILVTIITPWGKLWAKMTSCADTCTPGRRAGTRSGQWRRATGKHVASRQALWRYTCGRPPSVHWACSGARSANYTICVISMKFLTSGDLDLWPLNRLAVLLLSRVLDDYFDSKISPWCRYETKRDQYLLYVTHLHWTATSSALHKLT